MKMLTLKTILIPLFLYELSLLILYPFLPEAIALKYNFSGQITSTMPKLQALLMFAAFQMIYAAFLIYKLKTHQSIRPKYILGYFILMSMFIVSLVYPLVF